jgi:hypothetical protein
MEKSVSKMLYELTGDGDLLAVSPFSSDFTVPALTKCKGIIIGNGTVVSLDVKNSDGSTVSAVLISGPGTIPIPNNIIKVNKSGTDATSIWLIVKVPS